MFTITYMDNKRRQEAYAECYALAEVIVANLISNGITGEIEIWELKKMITV